MANYLRQITYNFNKARKELEEALAILENRSSSGKIEINQYLNITDDMAEVFKEKPVIIFQSQDIKILQVDNRIQNALRALDKIDNAALKVIGTKGIAND